MVRVRAIADEQSLRYANWVEGNRRAVSEATDGRVGYLHLPDMDGEGLSMFGRLFYPQVDKDAMLVDVRDNEDRPLVLHRPLERQLQRHVLGLCRLVRLDEAHGGLGLEQKKQRVREEERARGYETTTLRHYETARLREGEWGVISSQGGLVMSRTRPRHVRDMSQGGRAPRGATTA